MRSIPLTLALLAAALVLARGRTVDISYTLKVVNPERIAVRGNQTARDRFDAIYTAINSSPHRTGYITLPQTTAASLYYNDGDQVGVPLGVYHGDECVAVRRREHQGRQGAPEDAEEGSRRWGGGAVRQRSAGRQVLDASVVRCKMTLL